MSKLLPSTIQIWFVCKECNEKLETVAEFIEHKKAEHLDEFQQTTCIVFEESGNNIHRNSALKQIQGTVKEEPPKLDSDQISNAESQFSRSPEFNSNFEPVPPFYSLATDANIKYIPMNDAANISLSDFVLDESSIIINNSNAACDMANMIYLEETTINTSSNNDETDIGNDQDPLDCSLDLEVKPELIICESESKPEETTKIQPALIIPHFNPYVLLTRLTSQEIQNSTQSKFGRGGRTHLKNSLLKKNMKKRRSRCISSQNKSYECKICGAVFRRSDYLFNHRKVHSDVRPYSCPGPNCGHKFKTKTNLTIHLRHHSNQRPFLCRYPNCEKSFKTRGNLRQHEGTHPRFWSELQEILHI